MYIEIITTITSRITIGDDGFEGVEHSVVVDADEGASALPQEALVAVVEGGCKSVLMSLESE